MQPERSRFPMPVAQTKDLSLFRELFNDANKGNAKMLHQRLPKSELVYIKKVDHRIPTKASEPLNALIK